MEVNSLEGCIGEAKAGWLCQGERFGEEGQRGQLDHCLGDII